MKQSFILFTIFFLTFCLNSSCKWILIKAHGAHKPKIMTHNDVTDYLKKNKVTSYNHSLALANLKQFKTKQKKFPDAFFFNAAGHYLEYRETPKSCSANVELFVNKLTSATVMPDTSQTLAKLLNGTVDIKTHESLIIENLGNYDYYIVITWAEYIGKLNKDKSFEWLTHIDESNRKGIKICTILLSYDLFDFWNMSPKDVPVFKFN